MVRMRNSHLWLGAAVAMVLSMAALPREAAADGEGVHWAAALGLGARPDYEGSDRYRIIPVGGLKAAWESGRYAELAGTESSGSSVRVSGNLIANSPFELGPVLQYRLGRGDVESNFVDAMKNVDPAVEGGVFAAWQMKPWGVGITYAADMADAHDGSLIELAGEYKDAVSPNMDVGVTLASTWGSGSYNSTYFGVSGADSARSGLKEYNADSGFKDVGGRVKVGWAGDNWGPWKIIATFAYFRMVGEAADSPVVKKAGDENQFFGGIALAYQN